MKTEKNEKLQMLTLASGQIANMLMIIGVFVFFFFVLQNIGWL